MITRFLPPLLVALVVTVPVPAHAEHHKTCQGHPVTITASIQNGHGATIRGTSRSDVIAGTALEDLIYGRGGHDIICGKRANDTIIGGDGSDDIHGNPGIDEIRGGMGDDAIDAGCGDCFDPGGEHQHLFGGPGDDYIVGSDEMETISGGRGKDHIEGRGSHFTDLEGPDRLSGNAGNDTIIAGARDSAPDDNGGVSALALGGPGADELRDADGDSALDGGPGDDVLIGEKACCTMTWFATSAAGVVVDLAAGTATGDGTDTLDGVVSVMGSPFDDTIVGDELGNRIDGSAGNDSVSGAAGDDILDGGDGNDSIDGGDGTDTCFNGETITNCEN
ncbi:MAG TPA: calcium-binding protein [Actinomycetota bacterium]|nr:calcium-binding protein [Actinomycetota bacterium]